MNQAECSTNATYSKVRSEVTEFVLSLPAASIVDLPEISGVYFAVDDNSVVQYVGCAVDIYQRWKGHKLRSLANTYNWTIHFKPVDYDSFRSKEHEEAWFIATLRPEHNTSLKCRVHG